MDSVEAAAHCKNPVSVGLVDKNHDSSSIRNKTTLRRLRKTKILAPNLSENIVWVFLDRCSGFTAARSQRGEARGGGEGDAAQAHVQTVDLRGDGHLGEEGAVPGQAGRAAAVTALDVFDDVEDLLTLRLTSHSPDVQNGRHVLLPVHRERDGV